MNRNAAPPPDAPESAGSPDRARTPEPAGSPGAVRTPEPAHTPDATHTPDAARAPEAAPPADRLRAPRRSAAPAAKPAGKTSTLADKPIEHHYIVIEGPIGVGKTSLARKLADSLSADLVLEQAAENPFLERFYRHPRVGAFPAQLYFLFQRAQQLGSLNQADLFARLRIADYLLEKDRLFAQVTLDEAEYGLYDQVYAKLGIASPKPDLVVYLQAPVGVLLERIARRGIDYEQRIDAQYLERLNEAYAKFFHDYEAAPLLIVNAASIDPIGNESDYEELLTAIRRMGRGKLYFNPLRSGAI